jgi:hypothetical protein
MLLTSFSSKIKSLYMKYINIKYNKASSITTNLFCKYMHINGVRFSLFVYS